MDDLTGTVSARTSYEGLRAAHLGAVSAAMEDHIGRLDWRRDQIERHQTHRLRSLLTYARERSPFHAQRLGGLNPSLATVADLASLPVMTKQDAQDRWDSIVTTPDLDRRGAEQILAQQQWFSYTAADEQIFSSGGSSGVRGVYLWDWRNGGHQRPTRPGLPCWKQQFHHTPVPRYSMWPPPPRCRRS